MVGKGEEFDHGCLCVGDVDNSGNGYGELKFPYDVHLTLHQ